jgi:hypothetical protein
MVVLLFWMDWPPVVVFYARKLLEGLDSLDLFCMCRSDIRSEGKVASCKLQDFGMVEG